MCLTQAQEYPDFLTSEDGKGIACRIIEIKNRNIKYKTSKSSSIVTDKIVYYKDIYLSDTTKVKNPLNTIILKPDSGFAHVYLYNGEHTGFKVYHNGRELIKIKGGSFYLHKIKANKFHSYYSNGTNSLVEINAEDGKVYFIKGKLKSKATFGSGGINDSVASFSTDLILDKSNVSRYAVLSLKRKMNK